MTAIPGHCACRRLATAMITAVLALGCASVPAAPVGAIARYPALPRPDLPAGVAVDAGTEARMDAAWQALQSGDVGTASRIYRSVLREHPAFYPAETGAGIAALAAGDVNEALERLLGVTNRHPAYVPAWRGLIEARMGREEIEAAAAAVDRLVAIDPSWERERIRVEWARVRRVQALVEAGRAARADGRLDEADAALGRALALAPSSGSILRELAAIDVARGRTADAQMRLQQAATADPDDAETHAALGALFESAARWHEAATAYGRAAAIDPAWRTKAEASAAVAASYSLPQELRDVAGAASITRGQLAALIGLRLAALLDRAPSPRPIVVTDVQSHWAATWILRVTAAGVMDVHANHTFQPSEPIRRVDLAHAAARLLPLAVAARQADLAAWQRALPALADVPASHLFYQPVALVVAAGVMALDETGRFWPTRPVTGAEAVAVVARLDRLTGR